MEVGPAGGWDGEKERSKGPASSSSLSLPGQGDGEYSPGLKANLIRSRTQGAEECRSLYPQPSLGSCPWRCGASDSGCSSLSLTVSLFFSH